MQAAPVLASAWLASVILLVAALGGEAPRRCAIPASAASAAVPAAQMAGIDEPAALLRDMLGRD
ncbi:hypothetical protein Q8W71_17330 [Methylobacterium sp. NEAU 140]|uniref:hypothetical protein n=1 Tax=Methylobacterium sp. NEAU 140 TaxID=3064945 RepID=UPI00273235B8|nr:hypothetical protein [Methylobacterium sp. NEAU 140]MDP4024390.1 hypothetical protein [Methylobacterium sp. NEAU 140]